MSIKSGQRYKFTNEENGTVFDMTFWHRLQQHCHWHSGSSVKSVVGWRFHGGANQQWITERQDDGQWTIRSVQYQKYLGFENTPPTDGTPLGGLDEPQFWDIKVLPDSEDHDNPRIRLWVRGTLLVVEFPEETVDIVYLKVRTARDHGKNQVWVLEEYS